MKAFGKRIAMLVLLYGLPAIAATPKTKRAAPTTSAPKQRLIVLTDIEADADDSQSLVRLLLYANQIDIEGIIATTSVWMKTERHPGTIGRIVRQYGLVQPNLLKHESGFPTGAHMVSLIREGQATYGMDGIGPSKDSTGSELIVHALENDDPRPLWIAGWGGTNTLAQALQKIRATKSSVETSRLVAKLRVYAISDQDDSGPWLRSNFPTLFYVVSTGSYANATWRAINQVVDGIDNNQISNAWLAENIQQGHGPLGAVYPDVAWGLEGDTPSFLSLIPNGLNVPDRPDFGGWGGRYELSTPAPPSPGATVDGGIAMTRETRPIWTNAVDTYAPPRSANYGRPERRGNISFNDFQVTLWRWRSEFQNDMAARIGWTTLPYDKANHPPVARLTHPCNLTVHSGETIVLDGSASSDPDGDSLSYLWFNYAEAGSWKQPIAIDGVDDTYRAKVKAPIVSRPETAHFIFMVTDKGQPALTRYKRVILTIVPSSGPPLPKP